MPTSQIGVLASHPDCNSWLWFSINADPERHPHRVPNTHGRAEVAMSQSQHNQACQCRPAGSQQAGKSALDSFFSLSLHPSLRPPSQVNKTCFQKEKDGNSEKELAFGLDK